MVGTPDVIAERIERLQSVAGLQRYQLFPSVPYLSFRQSMSSLELFGTEVMPRFAKKRDAVPAH